MPSSTGLQRSFDLSGDFARTALADTEASETADKARLSAEVTLYKTGVEVLARGRVEAALTMVCSRCVGPADVTISAPFEVLFLPRDADVPEGQEISADEPDVIGYDDEQIDLEQTLREEIVLALPYAPLCSEACKGLCANCGKDLNEGPCDCPEVSGDERLAALRDLKV